MTSSLATASLDQIDVSDLLALVEHAPTLGDGARAGVGGESGCSVRAYRIWLECAMVRASTAATRRLIEDVLDDIAVIGPIDDELHDLVVGALASVESALECDEQLR